MLLVSAKPKNPEKNYKKTTTENQIKRTSQFFLFVIAL